MHELLAVNAASWQQELADIEVNHYPTFRGKMPAELPEELFALKRRLEQASAE